jgi:hypothetical protein
MTYWVSALSVDVSKNSAALARHISEAIDLEKGHFQTSANGI